MSPQGCKVGWSSTRLEGRLQHSTHECLRADSRCWSLQSPVEACTSQGRRWAWAVGGARSWRNSSVWQRRDAGKMLSLSVHIGPCTHVHTFIYTHIHMQACTHLHIHAHIYMYRHTHVHIHSCIRGICTSAHSAVALGPGRVGEVRLKRPACAAETCGACSPSDRASWEHSAVRGVCHWKGSDFGGWTGVL